MKKAKNLLLLLIQLCVYTVEYHADQANADKNEMMSLDWKSTSQSNPINTATTSTKDGNTIQCNAQMSKNQVSPMCPDGLTYCSTYECGQTYCYTRTKPQPFPPKCPYPNPVPWETISSIHFFNSDVWIMAKRNTTGQFGPFLWMEGSHYGHIVDTYYNPPGNRTTKNCLVNKNSNDFESVSCNDSYAGLCVYYYDVKLYRNNYCKNHYEIFNKYTNCIPDSIDTENNTCYCESNQANGQFKRHNKPEKTRFLFCDQLAEPITEMQNHLLVKHFSSKYKTCWFGLINQNGNLNWTISNAPVNYNSWADVENLNYAKPFGAITASPDKGWILTDDDGQIECGICQLKNSYDKNVSIQVLYDELSNQIKVIIKNFHELSDLYHGSYLLFCFVGPTDKYFQRQLEYNIFTKTTKFVNTKTKFTINTVDYPVYYWCEGFQHPNRSPVYSNKILVYKTMGGCEYAIRVTTDTVEDPYVSLVHLYVCSYIKQNLKSIIATPFVRTMNILNYNENANSVEMLLHISLGPSHDKELEYYNILHDFNKMIQLDTYITNFSNLRRSDVCLATSTSSNGLLLKWLETLIGITTLPKKPCLQKNGMPVMRKCAGDFWQGGYWTDVIGVCENNVDQSEKTRELYDLLTNEHVTANELSGNLSIITADKNDITVMDIYLISEILEKLQTFEEEINTNDVVTSISNIMNFDVKLLKTAQETLNCTDKILCNLDRTLAKYKLPTNNYSVVSSKNLLVQINNIKSTNITGLSLRRIFDGDNFDSFTLVPVYTNITIGNLLEDDIELAAYLPKDLIVEIEESYSEEINLVMVLFYNDALFNENVEETRQPNSKIISILIPGYSSSFDTPIPIIFKPTYKINFDKKCAFWNYGRDTTMSNSYGSWLGDTIPEAVSSNKIHSICHFDHVTHFALLMMGSLTNKGQNFQSHTRTLDIITGIGATLSLTTIVAMFIIAIIFENWIQSCSSKVILHFSVAIALQIILLYVADKVGKNSCLCTAVGAALHYVVLSQFCWMLTIAILQYKKFVIVFQKRIPHFLAKSCVFCWCFPLLPITVLLALSTESYKQNQNGLCYPSGKYFYFGIVLPVSIVVTINSLIFIKIICSVCRRKIKAYGPKQDNVKLQVVLGVLLFFLLGISWLFGLALALGGSIIFAYLFCLTATFQGFVMFLFFVVMNKKLNQVWMLCKGISCGNGQRRNSSLRQIMESNSRSDGMEVSSGEQGNCAP